MGGLCFWLPDRTIKKKSTLCIKLNEINFFGGCKRSSHLLENADNSTKRLPRRLNSTEPLLSISRELKVPVLNEASTSRLDHKNSFLEVAAAMGLEKAVEVLDSLGSSMSDFKAQNGFFSGVKSGGNKISILAFEVANTITRATNLFSSFSEKNIQFLKIEILHSEGVQKLVSTDMKELLIIAAADKREELEVFSREVIRFGDSCKDPQWHNLGRYFSKLDSEYSNDKQERLEVEKTVQELITLVKHTSELYHELHTLDRFEQDIRQNSVEVGSLHLPQRVENHLVLQAEMKEQRKLVECLKKKSLWSKRLEQIVEKLVDIVAYLHQAIQEAFGCDDRTMANEELIRSSQSLGEVGLALHYANLIKQLDNIACRPASLPLAARENLYHSLPSIVKTALRFHLQIEPFKDLTMSQVKDEMEKTLRWLVPIAVHTIKAHQGFGWVGEWASAGCENGSDASMPNNLVRLQTLHHADKKKADLYILELVTLLHHLINLARDRDSCVGAIHFQPPACRKPVFHSKMHKLFSFVHCSRATMIQLSEEDRDLLDKVPQKGLSPGISKSQEFSFARKGARIWAISKSTGGTHMSNNTDH